jgi:hypothetical protein
MLPFRSLLIPGSLLMLTAALAGAAVTPSGVAGAAPAPATSPKAAPAAGSLPSGAAGAAAAAGRRIEIPSPQGKPYPYSIELPAGWQVQSSKNVPGVFLGPPANGEPDSDPRMIYVRVSPASVLDPDAVAASIKKSVPADGSWSAPLVEVHEIAGVRGVLVRMDSGSGDQARSTLVLKMPLGQTSLDLMASAPRAEFERLLPGYQRVMLSVLPAK